MNKPVYENTLFKNISSLIKESKQQVAIAVNATISMLYWRIGKQINDDFLQSSRADYGAQVIKSLAQELSSQYGKGWSEK